MISLNHLDEICKLNKGTYQCVYLGFNNGWNCMKDSSLKNIIQKEASKSLERQIKVASGDNCSGYNVMKDIR